MDKRRWKIHKQLDYILISNNIKNWLNYSKTKGTANSNSTNQHKMLYMEIRVKFEEKGKRERAPETHQLQRQPTTRQYRQTNPQQK